MLAFVATVGLPGSGKSTWAEGWVAQDPANRARVNRDKLRETLRGSLVWGDPDLERQVTIAQHALIRALLGAGVSVVSDDTNLKPVHLYQLLLIAQECGAEVTIHRMDTPVEECVRRDALRPPEQRVGAEVIRRMAEQQGSAAL